MKKMINYAIGAVALLALWQLAHIVLDSNVLPSPWAVMLALPGLLGRGIGGHMLSSLARVFVAILLSMLLGLIVGIVAAGDGIVARVLTAFLYFTYPMPRVAMLPVVLLIFGISNTAKIIMVGLIVVYPIVVIVRDSIRDIPRPMYNNLICYGANKWQIFTHITLPWAVTAMFSTLRVSLGTSFSVLFFVETYGTRTGMGFFIQDAWMRVAYVDMFGGIMILGLAGFIIFVLVDIMEHFLLKWKH